MTAPLTPHGPGFRFVDDFKPGADGGGTASKYIDPALPFLADHFPGRPLMPAVLLAECAAQAAGILWMHGRGTTDTPLFVASLDQFRILGPVVPGMTVVTHVRIVKEFGTLAMFEAECSADGQPVARGRLTLSRTIGGTD